MARDYLRDFKTDLSYLADKAVLVTGGTGSFGRAFIRNLLERTETRRIIIFSRDEFKQYEMASKFEGHDGYKRLRFFIGDVRDRDRLEMALHGVDYVIHAAALKHVPAAEYNPFECIKTNVTGAENVAYASHRAGVKRIIALSTDKAANPINLYGASKLAADKIFVAANNVAGAGGVRSSVVRYGNVLGSRGSVVPFFRRLIAEGADHLPITDARMTRFWITLQQGVDFVLSSLATMQGGELFIPKIPSMKMTDMATCLAPELPQREIGIRPGEKLHEVMVTADDARTTVELPDRFVVQPQLGFWEGRGSVIADSSPVVPEFVYSSDLNTEWLDESGFQEMLKHAG